MFPTFGKSINLLLTCFVFVIFLTACVGEPKFEIVSLNLNDTQTQTINGRQLTLRTDYFLVENNSINDHSMRDFIADFVSYSDSLKNKYPYYQMRFYKKTNNVIAEEVQKFPENLQWKFFEDEKPIVIYDFQFGELMFEPK